MATWLRQDLVPGLRDNTRLVLADREPPVAAWIRDFGDLLATVPLANLAAADAVALLRREGLSDAKAAQVARFTHGHPLALRLAASARGARPDLTAPDAAVATVVTELARVYLSGLDQPTRAVLDAACALRPPTMSLLGALLPDVPPNDAYDMLRPLPFVDFGPEGPVLHDTVARDPDGSPAAFQYLCEATSVPAWLLAADPVAATWREHLRANPVPRGQQVLFQRYTLASDGGEAITPAHAALILDLKQRYLEMRPRLRRIYSLAADPAAQAVSDRAARIRPSPGRRRRDRGNRLPRPLQRLRTVLDRRLADRSRRAGNAHLKRHPARSRPPPAHPRRHPRRSHQAGIRRPATCTNAKDGSSAGWRCCVTYGAMTGAAAVMSPRS